ncbi:MAG: CBS domain-containing protein [Desulfomonile tiedjei]|nr:CBS domain-containing protein [Desulfomonile tiedjei]
MLVKYWMNKDVVPIDISASMQDAITSMKDKQIALLPVLKGGDLVGVITDRDLKRASASDATTLDVHELGYLLSKIQVGDIMTKNPITVPPDFTLEETASVLLQNRISGAPVLDANGAVVGIITQADLFRALISLTGLEKRGVQFAFQVDDRPGSIKDVTDIIREYAGRLVSILTSYERATPGFRRLYLRVFGLDRRKLPKLLDALRDKAPILYMVDHRDGTREEFIEADRT